MNAPNSEEAPTRDRELELAATVPLPRGRELRVYIVRSPLGQFLHLAEYEPTGRGGRMTPSRWGVHIGLEYLPAIRSALTEAEAAAREQGLLLDSRIEAA